MASANVNDSTRQSGVVLINSGEPSDGTKATSTRVSATATARPRTPPMSESSTLSTSSWRTSCPREAPSDSRTAISRCRAKARAISRLATLAQAMSSTSPTMPISTSSGVEKSLRSGE